MKSDDLRILRLNPFVFPSNTDFHFTLLITSVICFSLVLYFFMSTNFAFNDNSQNQCIQNVAKNYGVPQSSVMDKEIDSYSNFINPNLAPISKEFEIEKNNANKISECFSSARDTERWWVFKGICSLFGLTVILYWFFPTLFIRWKKFQNLKEDAPEIEEYLINLCNEIKFEPSPAFLMDALDPATDTGQAFGRFGKYYVKLSGGLITLFYKNEEQFKSIVLHELAHIKNKDVNKTYLTIIIFPSFIISFILLQLFYLNSLTSFTSYFKNIDFYILFFLIVLSTTALLRSREYYADIRASTWAGTTNHLDNIFSQPTASTTSILKGWKKYLSPLAGVHPSPKTRRLTLINTYGLFKMSLIENFAVGVAVAISLTPLQGVLSMVGNQSLTIGYLLPCFLVALLAVGVIGVGTWRSSFAELIKGEIPHNAGQLGLAMGIGYVTYEILQFNNPLNNLYFTLIWYAMFLGGLWCIFRWIEISSSVWIEISTSQKFIQQAYRIGLSIAVLLLSIYLSLLFFVKDNVYLAVKLFFASFQVIFLHPITWIFFISLWAFPLSAWFWRKNNVLSSNRNWNWIFLDATPEYWSMPQQLPLQPWLAIKVATYSAAVFFVLLLLIKLVVYFMLSEEIRTTNLYKIWIFYSQIGFAIVLQMITAVIVTKKIKRLGALHGLLAAFIGGFLMSIGFLCINLIFGGSIDSSFAWQIFSFTVNGGAVLSLLFALVIKALQELAGKDKITS